MNLQLRANILCGVPPQSQRALCGDFCNSWRHLLFRWLFDFLKNLVWKYLCLKTPGLFTFYCNYSFLPLYFVLSMCLNFYFFYSFFLPFFLNWVFSPFLCFSALFISHCLGVTLEMYHEYLICQNKKMNSMFTTLQNITRTLTSISSCQKVLVYFGIFIHVYSLTHMILLYYFI